MYSKWKKEWLEMTNEFDNEYNFRGGNDQISGTSYVMTVPVTWKLFGITKQDERTWLGDFESETEIAGIANFFANNPHFEHMEIHEGNKLKYAVMRIVGGSHD